MIDSAVVIVKLLQPDGTGKITYRGPWKEFEQQLIRKYLQEPTETGRVRYIGSDNNYIRFTPNVAVNSKFLRIHYCKKHGFIYGRKAKRWFGVN